MRETSINIADTLVIDEDIDPILTEDTVDMSDYLHALGVPFQASQLYWQVGNIEKIQGWILHLSIIETQLVQLINQIVPVLIKEKATFKIARNRPTAEKLIAGTFGFHNLAKIFCIYPESEDSTETLAALLIDHTKNFKGPAIPTDFHLGSIVYTRYGSFSPIMVRDVKGRLIKHIYNEKGELVPDPYNIPFSFASSIPWPFSHIASPNVPKSGKLVNARYYPISTIRNAPRGDVRKAIYFRRLWDIKACIIKQARSNMWSDDTARDAADRLHWQHDLCKQLDGVIPVPKIFDRFVENGDTFLAMEFVKGMQLEKWLTDKQKARPWFSLPLSDQQAIYEIIGQIVDITQRLHETGIIHRDISPGNFIVTPKNRVIPIDLELAWSSKTEIPSPPFMLGTPGFMSPQQENRERPSIKDDIYAIGALIMKACTVLGLSQIQAASDEDLRSKLIFFIRDERIVTLVADCLKNDPAERPDLDTIKKVIISAKSNKLPPVIDVPLTFDPAKITQVIQFAINGLANPKLLSPSSRWLSVWNREEDAIEPDTEQGREYYIGWHTGMAGPLWLVALAKRFGLNVSSCEEPYRQSWNYINRHYFIDPPSFIPSLFYGGAGIAIALAEAITAGLLPPSETMRNRLKDCFSVTASELHLSTGLSGQGLALLYASPFLKPAFANTTLELYIGTLLDQQLPDGSWNLKDEENGKIPLALEHGISGIIWFLLAYLQNTSDSRIRPAVDKALNWLIGNKSNKKAWSEMEKDQASDIWFSGRRAVDTTHLMLKAFETLQDQRYKMIAEKNLHTIPPRPVLTSLSLNNGAARIGELYLEAHRILKSPAWKDQADWITGIFMHTFVPRNGTEGYWLMSHETQTADLFRGNSGIIRYLLKYLSNEKLIYPI
jgi:serine/threonine protein kinase